jgi:hypothetical protein
VPDNFTVIWRDLPIGRIMLAPGLPPHVPQWRWTCNFYGKPGCGSGSGANSGRHVLILMMISERRRDVLHGPYVAKERSRRGSEIAATMYDPIYPTTR